ncbi:MAG: 2-amino-4-hydroxy-6-hydroxymethyldihydropteridine diphosphokinase [Planctomycetes bacterium]|nr:2-amino-4-hydroxy-6-hydroxymethyldihydropteridine diphosphokinase [Planctomycetota bacterium]
MNATAYIALGANLGNRCAALAGAVRTLTTEHDATLRAASSLYETSAVGGPAGQPDYLNAVVSIATRLPPHDLLDALLQVELLHGRRRDVRHGSRTLDLDLLLYDDCVIASDRLQVPHPRVHLRRFVLTPLAEIAPKLVHPRLGLTVTQLLARLESGEYLRPCAGPEWIAEATLSTY